jgi:pilus assembly protein CpaB
MIVKRSQMNPRNVTLLLAAVLALGTGVLLFNYLSGVNMAANKVEAKRVVLVAAHSIPAQTVITNDMLDRAIRPATSVEPDSVDPAQVQAVVGSIALVAIPAGGTLTQSRIARPSALSLTAKVRKGLRAMTIPIDRVKGVAGLISIGDRVDIIAIQQPRTDGAPTARAILRGITVLAMGMTFASASNASPAPDAGNETTATLEVTPQQADLLALADMNTTLRLALRSPDEAVGSLPAEPLSFAIPNPYRVAAAPPAAAPAPAPAVSAGLVPAAHLRPSGPIIIDGDKVIADPR